MFFGPPSPVAMFMSCQDIPCMTAFINSLKFPWLMPPPAFLFLDFMGMIKDCQLYSVVSSSQAETSPLRHWCAFRIRCL